MKQTIQTLLLGVSLVALALLTGWQLLGSWAIVVLIAFLAAVAISVFGRPSVTRIRGARPITPHDSPMLTGMVDRLSNAAGLARKPHLLYVPSPTVNAAATSTGDDVSILITQGLLTSVSERELEGVVAHEIAHVRNKDLTLFRIVDVLRQATMLFTRAGWFMLIFAFPLLLMRGGFSPFAFLVLFAAPVLSWILELALLRTREFAADETAAKLTGDPDGLASALVRIEYRQRSLLGILFPVDRGFESSLFRTHPATRERVERLHALGRRPDRRVSTAGEGSGSRIDIRLV